jgi:hypothetical protein
MLGEQVVGLEAYAVVTYSGLAPTDQRLSDWMNAGLMCLRYTRTHVLHA